MREVFKSKCRVAVKYNPSLAHHMNDETKHIKITPSLLYERIAASCDRIGIVGLNPLAEIGPFLESACLDFGRLCNEDAEVNPRSFGRELAALAVSIAAHAPISRLLPNGRDALSDEQWSKLGFITMQDFNMVRLLPSLVALDLCLELSSGGALPERLKVMRGIPSHCWDLGREERLELTRLLSRATMAPRVPLGIIADRFSRLDAPHVGARLHVI